MKITQNTYLKSFFCTVLLLALVRCVFPSLAGDSCEQTDSSVSATQMPDSVLKDSTQRVSEPQQSLADSGLRIGASVPSVAAPKPMEKHRIMSVPSYKDAFPDMQDVQLASANKIGVKPVQDREEAENRKMELVFVGANPFFHIDRLRSSIPYLVPQASVLLQDIGRNFFDSLQIKGVPLHKIIVTSVLRTKDDVNRLRGHNGNATENSCHLYGTTFDICYNRYITVSNPDGPVRRQVRNDTLKWVLSEVLRDMRDRHRCYVKYEVKQGCFHITAR